MANEKYLEVFRKLVKLYMEGKLEEEIGNISVEDMDEDMLRQYIIAALGQSEAEDTDIKSIAKKALEEYSTEDDYGSVISIAKECTECTDGDKEPRCVHSCPFDALFKDNETKSIRLNKDNCIGCGDCIDACSHGKIVDKIEYLPIAAVLNTDKPVYAAVAPAYVGQFGEDVTPGKIRTALKMLGFKDLIEVAIFADIISIKEAVEFNNLVKSEDDFMITSCCCPIWMALLKKNYEKLYKHVTPSVSPMIAAGRVMKKIDEGCKVVFIGPCIAKKSEAKEKDIAGAIDYVMTFDELNEVFKALGINLKDIDEEISDCATRGGMIYARVGGVSECIESTVDMLYPRKVVHLKSAQGNGIKECKVLLNKALDGKLSVNFLEGMACIGGCVGGPKAVVDKEIGKKMVDKYASEVLYETPVESPCVLKILQAIGIDSLNELKEKNEKSAIFIRNL